MITKVFHLPDVIVTVTVEPRQPEPSGPKPPPDLATLQRAMKRPSRRSAPTTVAMDRLLMHVLTGPPMELFAPESERERMKHSCWAGGLAYVLSTALRRFLGDAIIHNDPIEDK